MCKGNRHWCNSQIIQKGPSSYSTLTQGHMLSIFLSWLLWFLTKASSDWYELYIFSIMTSSNGNIWCVTGPLRGESADHWWIPITKISGMELWCFFDFNLNKKLSKQSRCWCFDMLLHSLWRHCNYSSIHLKIGCQKINYANPGLTKWYHYYDTFVIVCEINISLKPAHW